MEPVTVAVLNPKGGSGKTSVCFHFSGYLATQGITHLLIDADPQANLSSQFLGPTIAASLPKEQTWATLLDERQSSPNEDLLQRTRFEHIRILAGNKRHIDPINMIRSTDPHYERSLYALRRFIARLGPEDGTEIVLIDCPGNLYHCSLMALVAADFILIPLEPENYGIEGVPDVHGHIEQARLFNPDLEILGYLITRIDRRWALHRHIEGEIRSQLGALMFETVMPVGSDFAVGTFAKDPVSFARPNSRGNAYLQDLGREMVERMTRHFSQSRMVAHG